MMSTRTSFPTVLIILLMACALRLWGLDFGLPQRFHPDEPVVVTRAIYGVGTNDWNPRAFHWPSFQIYLLGSEYATWFWLGLIGGYWETADPEFISYSLHAPGGFYYLGRLTTLIFGVASVYLIFLLAKQLIGPSAAIYSALFASMDPILTRHSRYITPDIPAEFFFLLSLILLLKLHQNLLSFSHPLGEKNRSSMLAFFKAIIITGAVIGLGTGTKYPIAILIAVLISVILFTKSVISFRHRLWALLIAFFSTISAFIFTTPYAILDWQTFIKDISVISQHMQTGHIGMEAHGGIWLASLRHLVIEYGWFWLIISLCGTLLFFSRNFFQKWLIGFSLLLVITGLAPLAVFSDRYLIPLIPFLIIGSTQILELVRTECLKMKLPAWAYAVVIYVVFMLICMHGLLTTLKDARNLTLSDTRQYALDWVINNIPAGSSIVKEQGGPDLYSVDLAPLAPEPTYVITEITPLFARTSIDKDPLDKLVAARPQWVITSSQVKNRYMRAGAEAEYPDVVAAFKIYYNLIENYLIEEQKFEPGKNIRGPSITIYRVPEGLWDRVVLEETKIENLNN